MANTHTTPFVRRMRTQGGTIYTFSSATEDIGLNINERNNIVKMSHYALLNIPPIDASGTLNRFNAFAIPGAFDAYQTSGSVKDGRTVIAESFQNYALNLESHLLDASAYNAELPTTVAERVFWKWLKETGAIRWTGTIDNSINGTQYWEEEADDSSTYGSVVKAIGEISAGAVRNGTFGTYNETYILVPTSFGQTKAFFKQVEDDNYYLGMKIPASGIGNARILGRETYTKPHPDGLDLTAFYDVMDSSSKTGNYVMTYFDDSITRAGWWYTYQGINPTYYSYYTDKPNYVNVTVGNFNTPLTYKYLSNIVTFNRSKLDAIALELNLSKLGSLSVWGDNNSTDSNLTFDKMAIEYAVDDNYDFNAVLLYYSVKSKTGEVLATNLLGVLFLDPPSGNTSNYPLSEIKIPSITKLQSGASGFGTSYSFRLNIKSDYMLDDTLSIVTDTTASQISVEDFAQVFDSLNKSLTILNQHTGTINYITEQYLDISSTNTDMLNDIADLQYKVNDIARDITGTENTLAMFTAGDDPIGDSSIFMYNGYIGFFNNRPSFPVQIDASLKVTDIYISNAIRDTSNNILLSYGSPLQLGSSTNYRDVAIYSGNNAPAITVDVCNNIHFNGFLFSPFVRDTSVEGGGVKWANNGVYSYLKVDVSAIEGGVDKSYVDTSLNKKADKTYVDGSLATTINTFNSSVNSAFASNSSLGILTAKVNYLDACLGYTSKLALSTNASMGWMKTYVDGSIANHKHDTIYLKEASLSNDFIWNNGSLEVSLGSILGLDAYATNASIATASFATNSSVATAGFATDASLTSLLQNYYTKSQIDASFYDVIEASTLFYTKTETAALYVAKAGDIMTGKLIVNASLSVTSTIAYNRIEPTNETYSTYIGILAGASGNDINNTAVGYEALHMNTNQNNTAVGQSALKNNTVGYSNTALGSGAMESNIQGYYNTAVGSYSLWKNTEEQNVAIGSGTFYNKAKGINNIAIGYSAAQYTKAGTDLSTANYSIYIGAFTRGSNASTNNFNEIVIGYDASSMGNNTTVLGNSACVSTYISGAVYLNNKSIYGVATPVNASDAVNKSYVDAKVINKNFQNLTVSGSTFTWTAANGYNAKIILTTNSSINIPDVSNGDSGTLIVQQDGTGSRLLALPPKSLLNNAWTLTGTAGSIDIISFVYDGSNYYWNKGGSYA